MSEELLTAVQVSELTGLHRSYVIDLARQGRLPVAVRGCSPGRGQRPRPHLFRRHDIDAYMALPKFSRRGAAKPSQAKPKPAPARVPTIVAPAPPPVMVVAPDNHAQAIDAGRAAWEAGAYLVRPGLRDPRGFWLIRMGGGQFRPACVGERLQPGEAVIQIHSKAGSGEWRFQATDVRRQA